MRPPQTPHLFANAVLFGVRIRATQRLMKLDVRALAGEPGNDEPLDVARHGDHGQQYPWVVVRSNTHTDRRRWPQYQVRGHRQPDDGKPCPEGCHMVRKLNRMN